MQFQTLVKEISQKNKKLPSMKKLGSMASTRDTTMLEPKEKASTKVVPQLMRRLQLSLESMEDLKFALTAVSTSNLSLLKHVTAQIVQLPAGASSPPMRMAQINYSNRISKLTRTSLIVLI